MRLIALRCVVFVSRVCLCVASSCVVFFESLGDKLEVRQTRGHSHPKAHMKELHRRAWGMEPCRPAAEASALDGMIVCPLSPPIPCAAHSPWPPEVPRPTYAPLGPSGPLQAGAGASLGPPWQETPLLGRRPLLGEGPAVAPPEGPRVQVRPGQWAGRFVCCGACVAFSAVGRKIAAGEKPKGLPQGGGWLPSFWDLAAKSKGLWVGLLLSLNPFVQEEGGKKLLWPRISLELEGKPASCFSGRNPFPVLDPPRLGIWTHLFD